MKTICRLSVLLLLIFILPSCAVAGGIFKAGMVGGILLVVGIIALIIFLLSKAGKN